MKSQSRSKRRLGFGVAIISLLASVTCARAENRGALWMVVHDLCVVDEQNLHYPAPCAKVDLAEGEDNGWAILKDLQGKTQYLLVPTRRISGVDDPLIGTTALPNYWAPAWTARALVSEKAGKDLPREAIGMAINSAEARSQDQLHIHIDCLRIDVLDALTRHQNEIGGRWSFLRVPLAGQHYRARRIEGDAPSPDPFRLALEDARMIGAPMRDETIAAVGARFSEGKDGFILLANHAGAGKRAHAEDLLDHSCAIAAQ